jgi:hypothetical protein
MPGCEGTTAVWISSGLLPLRVGGGGLNFLPQEHDTEIVVTTSERNQHAPTTLAERVEKWLEPDSRRLLQQE